MRTVLIASKSVLDELNQYQSLISKVIDSNDVFLCEWMQSGRTIEQTIPKLYESIQDAVNWRAIIIDDTGNVNSKNPFDNIMVADPSNGNREKDLSLQFKSIESAAKLPLSRLTMMLGGVPNLSVPLRTKKEPKFKNEEEEKRYKAAVKKLKQENTEENKKRFELEHTLKEEMELMANRPSELLLLSCRIVLEQADKQAATLSWDVKPENKYSRFVENNMYADMARFMVFDSVPQEHLNYRLDRFRFLMLALHLAISEIPISSLRAYRLYKINCSVNTDCLSRLIINYYAMLSATKRYIFGLLKELRKKSECELSSGEIASLFAIQEPIKLLLDEISTDELYAQHKTIGLSKDCPRSERIYWSEQYKSIQIAFIRFFKQPRRSLKQAVVFMKKRNEIYDERVLFLNEFQKEDLQEAIDNEERKMVSIRTSDISNVAVYQKQMSEADKEIKKKISTRMDKKTTIISGVTALSIYSFGFIHLFVNSFSDSNSFLLSFLLFLFAFSLLFLVGLLALFYLRNILVNRFKHFNYVAGGIINGIKNSMEQFSKYLSNLCGVMKGYSLFALVQDNQCSFTSKSEFYKKHLIAIMRNESLCEDWLESFKLENFKNHENEGNVLFDRDFGSDKNLDYGVPMKISEKRIPFGLSGEEIVTPFSFFDNITIDREELFDA